MTEEVRARYVAIRLRKSKISAERKSPPAEMIRRPVTSHQSCGSHWRVSEHGSGKGSRNGSGANGQCAFAPYVRALCVKQRKPRERMRRPKRGAEANGRESERLWLCVKYFVRGSRCYWHISSSVEFNIA